MVLSFLPSKYIAHSPFSVMYFATLFSFFSFPCALCFCLSPWNSHYLLLNQYLAKQRWQEPQRTYLKRHADHIREPSSTMASAFGSNFCLKHYCLCPVQHSRH